MVTAVLVVMETMAVLVAKWAKTAEVAMEEAEAMCSHRPVGAIYYHCPQKCCC